MIVTILPQVATTQAATKKSIVLYKGEKIYYTDYSAVKSVKSSNSKIATVNKYGKVKGNNTGNCNVTATVKNTNYNYMFKINVAEK